MLAKLIGDTNGALVYLTGTSEPLLGQRYPGGGLITGAVPYTTAVLGALGIEVELQWVRSQWGEGSTTQGTVHLTDAQAKALRQADETIRASASLNLIWEDVADAAARAAVEALEGSS